MPGQHGRGVMQALHPVLQMLRSRRIKSWPLQTLGFVLCLKVHPSLSYRLGAKIGASRWTRLYSALKVN
ncbi:MAG: hypothetical protein QW767_01325 [Thermoprotei archaeon]